MIDINEYHKGEYCKYTSSSRLICQEGFCYKCGIREEHDLLYKLIDSGRLETALTLSLSKHLGRN